MKYICVGDNVIDYYVNNKRMYPGGNALNVAVHLKKLGAESAYFGNFGTDGMAGVIQRALDKFEVDYSNCYTIEGATTKHCVYNVVDGERSFIKVELGDNWQGPMHLTAADMDYISTFDVVISSCNAKMEYEMLRIGALNNVFVYDFGEKEKYRTDEYLSKVCPDLDLALFSLEPCSISEILQFAKRILSFGAKNVLVTMGKRGQYLINDDIMIFGETKLVDAVDTMGAGDSFLAAFVKCMAEAGWKKGERFTPEKTKAALEAGANYARENCLVEGGFGYEVLES